MNMKMRKLNAENEKKAIEHMMNQLAILAPNLFRIELSIGTPKKTQIIKGNSWVKEGVAYYSMPLTLKYYTTPTSQSFCKILEQTLKSLALTASEIKEYKESGEKCYQFKIVPNKEGQWPFYNNEKYWSSYDDETSSQFFRTPFQNRLLEVLNQIMIVSLFSAYDLDIIGVGKYNFLYQEWGVDRYEYDIYLSDRRPITKENDIINLNEGRWKYKIKSGFLSNLDSVDSLCIIQSPNVIFSEEELFKISEIKMLKNDNHFLHVCSVFRNTEMFEYFKKIMGDSISFYKKGNYVEFKCDKYYEPGNETIKKLKNKEWIPIETIKFKFDLINNIWYFNDEVFLECRGNHFHAKDERINNRFALGISDDGVKYLLYIDEYIQRHIFHITGN